MEIVARFRDSLGGSRQGSVLNISLGGMYVSTGHPLHKGIMTVLELAEPSRGDLLKIGGMVVRSDASLGMALEFVDKDNGGIRELIRGIQRRAGVALAREAVPEQRGEPRLGLLSSHFQMTKKNPRERTDGDNVKKEKRRHSRKLLRIEARYQDPDSKVLKGILRNISVSGLYIETTNTLAPQTRLHMSLDATDIGKVIDVAGKVIRVDEMKGMAIEFDDKENREIRLLLSTLRKLDQASMLALSRSGLGD